MLAFQFPVKEIYRREPNNEDLEDSTVINPVQIQMKPYPELE